MLCATEILQLLNLLVAAEICSKHYFFLPAEIQQPSNLLGDAEFLPPSNLLVADAEILQPSYLLGAAEIEKPSNVLVCCCGEYWLAVLSVRTRPRTFSKYIPEQTLLIRNFLHHWKCSKKSHAQGLERKRKLQAFISCLMFAKKGRKTKLQEE